MIAKVPTHPASKRMEVRHPIALSSFFVKSQSIVSSRNGVRIRVIRSSQVLPVESRAIGRCMDAGNNAGSNSSDNTLS